MGGKGIDAVDIIHARRARNLAQAAGTVRSLCWQCPELAWGRQGRSRSRVRC